MPRECTYCGAPLKLKKGEMQSYFERRETCAKRCSSMKSMKLVLTAEEIVAAAARVRQETLMRMRDDSLDRKWSKPRKKRKRRRQ